jgi:flagellin-like protein
VYRRGAISPFIATVVLVAITLTLGGVHYHQFSLLISAEARHPSISLAGINVGADRQTIVVGFKNDGNVQFTVSKLQLDYQSRQQQFLVGGTGNASVIAGTPQVTPGGQVTIRFAIVGFSIPDLSAFTLTVVSDQVARAFTIQA